MSDSPTPEGVLGADEVCGKCSRQAMLSNVGGALWCQSCLAYAGLIFLSSGEPAPTPCIDCGGKLSASESRIFTVCGGCWNARHRTDAGACEDGEEEQQTIVRLTSEKAQLEAQLAKERQFLEAAWHENAQLSLRVASLQADGERLDWQEIAVPSGAFREALATLPGYPNWTGTIREMIDTARRIDASRSATLPEKDQANG